MANRLGQHWLLLRGLSREAAHWGEFVPLMQHAFPEAQITTLDLPGTGAFYRQTSPASITAIADNLRVQALNKGLLQRPMTVLALSLGAMVAWEWLLQHPEDLSGAVLINTSFGGLSPFYRRLSWQCYGRFITLTLQRDVYRKELAILRLVSNRREGEEAIVRQWQDIQNARPISSGTGLRQIIAAATYCPPATAPQRRVLLLNSRQDGMVDAVCSAAIAQRWHLPLHIHPWAGHDLPLDDPAWVIENTKQWITRT